MPRICAGELRAPRRCDCATLTPPPLPRPPAWICAFTTQTLPPSFFAASTASSTVNAGKPRGVGTPNLRKISLPWYSWIFTLASASRLSIPLRIPARAPFRCVVSSAWQWSSWNGLRAVVLLFLHLAGEGLDRGGRQPASISVRCVQPRTPPRSSFAFCRNRAPDSGRRASGRQARSSRSRPDRAPRPIDAAASTMVNLRSMVRRSHMSCIGWPARRTPVFRW